MLSIVHTLNFHTAAQSFTGYTHIDTHNTTTRVSTHESFVAKS